MDFFSTQSILTFFLVLTRITGMLISAPLFGTGQIPTMVKIAMSFGLTIIMFPVIYQQTHLVIMNDLYIFGIIAAKEIIIGVLIGFMADMMISAVQMGGELLSLLMGLSIANIVDPVTRQNVPVIGQFYLMLALLLFLFIDGHHWLFAAIQTSYQAVPIGMDFPHIHKVLEKFVLLSSQIFLVAVLLILPIFAIMIATEIGLACMAKVMPQMNIFVVGLPLKIYIGLASMLMFMPISKNFIMNIFKTLGYQLYKLFV